MLGLLLLYFIGKSFYNLAQKHGKSKWGFAILGVVTYYAGTFIGGLAIGLMAPTFVMNTEDIIIGLIALPIGVAFCATLYFILKNNWEKQTNAHVTSEEVLDAEIIE
tara:strand:- start:133 stop:453 length:321 start_codon:yes stop_codon:yes gene_type:complete